MRIITVLGSPRRKGNTAAVLEMFERLASGDHSIERVNVTDHAVGGCLGCYACQTETDRSGCVQSDDGEAILARIAAADAVVYASPVYAWSVSAQLKALLDRHFCLVKWDHDGEVARALFEGKRTALLVTCGGSAEDNADLVSQIFAREMRYLRCRSAGTFVVPHCTDSGSPGDGAAGTAREMLERLTAL